MSDSTQIQWTDYTWSPWLGCRKVSPGCDNCYITSTTPYRVRHITHGSRREELSDGYWTLPDRWNRKAVRAGTRPRVFPSLCDPFDSEVELKWKIEFWKLVWRTSNLTWLILTKRPQNFHIDWLRMIQVGAIARGGLPRNVWFGVSVEDQKRADERIPILLNIEAKVRFLSVEPMLERIDLRIAAFNGADSFASLEGIHWAIFGGESGANARPCETEWIRDGVTQCQAAAVPAFVKQLGRNPTWSDADMQVKWYEVFSDPKGGNVDEWPHDLRVREFPKIKP